jgi:hypothetical protein
MRSQCYHWSATESTNVPANPPAEGVGLGRRRCYARHVCRLPRRLFLIGFGLFGLSCLSPTIPMPPPSRPDIEGPDAEGMVVLSGGVEAGAHVYAENRRTGDIRGQQTNTGVYRIVIGAQVGDQMSLFYAHNGKFSPSVEFVIPEPNR